jgi:hypothetical protein
MVMILLLQSISERLFESLADAFESMCYYEVSARYSAIENGTASWGISCMHVDGGGLIFEWAGYPLLISSIQQLWRSPAK